MLKRLVAVFLFFPATAHCRTLTQLISDSRILAKDAASTRQRFTDTNYTDWLNEGQRLVIARTWCLQRSFSFGLLPGTTYYSLPSDFLALRRVTRGQLMINELSPAALDGRSEGWEAASGMPVYYFINFSSRNVIGFTPWPATASDTDTIKLEYFQQPTDMVLTSDAPFNAVGQFTAYHNNLSYYAAARAAEVDSRRDIADFYMQQFERYVETMGQKCEARPNYMPSASGRP